MTKYSIFRTHPVASAADTLLRYAAELCAALHRHAVASALLRPQPDPIAVDTATEKSVRKLTEAYTHLASLRAAEATAEGSPLPQDIEERLADARDLLQETCVCVTRLQYIVRAESLIRGTGAAKSTPTFNVDATRRAIAALRALNESLRADFELAMALETAHRRGVGLDEAERQLRARWE